MFGHHVLKDTTHHSHKIHPVHSVAVGVEKFWNTIWAKVIIIALFTAIGATQIIMFSVGLPVNGQTKSDPQAWQTWVSLAITSLASLLAVYSVVYTVKQSPKFFYFCEVATILFIINDIFLLLFFDLIKNVIYFFLYIKRRIAWQKLQKLNDALNSPNPQQASKELKIQKMTNKDRVIIVFTVLAAIALLGWWMTMLSENTVIKDPLPYLDAAALVVGVSGAYFITKSYMESWIFFMVADTLGIIIFALMGQWSVVIMSVVFLIIDVTTTMMWIDALDQQKKKLENITKPKTA